MKHDEKTKLNPPLTSEKTDNSKSSKAKKVEQNLPDKGHLKTDRPGFDLSGSSEDTSAGTGLGLGNDSFETPGDRRLPGRRLNSKLTIPRWGGPLAHSTINCNKKPSGSKT